MIFARTQQHRCRESAHQGIGCQQFGVLRQGHPGVPNGYSHHCQQGHTRGKQVEKLERSPERQVQGSGANRFQRVRERVEASAPESLRPYDCGSPGQQPANDAAGGIEVNPVPIHHQFQKQRYRNQQGHDSYTIEDLRPNPVLDRTIRIAVRDTGCADRDHRQAGRSPGQHVLGWFRNPSGVACVLRQVARGLQASQLQHFGSYCLKFLALRCRRCFETAKPFVQLRQQFFGELLHGDYCTASTCIWDKSLPTRLCFASEC